MKWKVVYLVLVCLLTVSCMDDPKTYPNTYKGNFESLWTIIDQKYCYLDYKHINWDSIHTAYSPRVDTVSSQYAFFDLMGKMLSELKDGHVNLYTPFDRSRYWKWFEDYPKNFNSDLIYNAHYLGDNYRIAGNFKYATIRGGKVGYVYYADFSDSFGDANMGYIFQSFSSCKGMIIDVRNNGGGYLTLAEQLASYFFPKDVTTGYIRHKTGTGHNEFSEPIELKTPAHKTLQWQRPVVILTNRMSYSATNSFVSRMKLAPQAIIVGDKTGGGGGMPLSSEIPNGWLVRFSACPMYDASMNHIEWGVDPDVKVDLSVSDQTLGYDTMIEKAIELILQ